MPSVLVWSLGQRLLHWGLAFSVVACVFSYEGGTWHEWFGYFALGLSIVRIGLGFWGGPFYRFTTFVLGPSKTYDYMKATLAGKAPRSINHNPLGAYMVVALLTCAAISGLTGWLYTTERFWGYAWLINLHAFFAWAFVLLVPLHLAGVLYASARHRENLVLCMLHGKKRQD